MAASKQCCEQYLRIVRALVVLCVVAGCGQTAWAGGARFITGQGWGTAPGSNVTWLTTQLPYFTDPGDLSPGVTRAQADGMVAAAAAVWNVPTSSLSLVQGGHLAEHVSTHNTTFDGTSLVFPQDVQILNEGNIPVAIVYDTDGGLIDLLLGTDASDPYGCEQNAVVGDVDDIHQRDSAIHHATLILNGRCVGSTPEQLTQMQYQLARAFGRVLGISWSQTNDNVFTAATTVTSNQLAYWPLMHPIDVLCGNYSYQCMTNPFSLREDDLNSLAQLYPVRQSSVPPGKQGTSNDALYLTGILYFPTGQGMDWVNITTRRQNNGVTEDWQTTSALTGYLYEQVEATPLSGGTVNSSGVTSPSLDGYFSFRRVPLDGVSNVFFITEPINPLYSGDYAVGPYVRPPVSPSGAPVTLIDYSALSAGDNGIFTQMHANDAAATCNPGNDGRETAPAAFNTSGWQNGLLCSWGHSSWWNVSIAAGHSWAVEIAATDETGAATVNKALPVVGVWGAGEASGTLPTLASQPAAFNSLALGVTQVQMGPQTGAQSFRFSVSDQFGAGRPDFSYVARVLYAATVAPLTVGSGGGQLVISGTGFRQGNQVLVNGIPGSVVSVTANQIIVNAPPMLVAGALVGVPVTVTVLDPGTGSSTSIPGGLSYLQLPDVMRTVSAPPALETGVTAPTPFAVRVLASDGLSPVANAAVAFSVSAGAAQLTACGGGSSCTVLTDAQGLAQTAVTGSVEGALTLTAQEVSGVASVQVVVVDTTPVRQAWFADTAHYLAAGASSMWSVPFHALEDGVAAAGVPVVWTVSSGTLQIAGNSVTGADGVANLVVSASAIPAGSVSTVTGCAWGVFCSTWTVYGVDASLWRVNAASGAAQSVPEGQALSHVVLAITDAAGHALEQAPVQVNQRVLAWQVDCSVDGRCPAQAVLGSTQATATSDESGIVTVVPLEVASVPQAVQVAASTGTQGFLTVTLTKTP